ncbi:MAG: UDP-3-O-(3-hydroxymyristoyl)glucosamine N-acyltransferase [Geobacter sp.]|nr:UDP-3-O-(3-hydroxymyristoyl)glucosamine N-acyltransferase [Geobacter sp.]
MKLTLREIAEHIGGKVIGDPETEVCGLGSLDDAVEGQIVFLANPKLAGKVAQSKATAVILPPGAEGFGKNVIETKNPYLAFAKVLTLFLETKSQPKTVMAGAFVSPEAVLGADVTVYPGAYVGERARIGDRVVIHPGAVVYEDAVIGDDTVIHANVSIRERCRIGKRVILHNGVVIGSDGFGYAPDGKSYYKIPQIGIVVIEDDVEVGANTTIDRAALDKTIIGRGSKIDNLVQIAHNVVVGENTVMAAQVGVAGSTKIGRNVTVGGQVAFAGHVTVADNTMLGGRTGVTSSITEAGIYSGLPAIPHKDWLRSSIIFTRLPEMRSSLTALEKRIKELEGLLSERGANDA